jgi:hypothetical protein
MQPEQRFTERYKKEITFAGICQYLNSYECGIVSRLAETYRDNMTLDNYQIQASK